MSPRRASVAVALILLAALAAGSANEYVHTHVGCTFDTHCFVCQHHAGSLAVGAPSVTTPAVLEAVGSPLAPTSNRVLPAPTRHEAPRGPPLV
jgi:hypothetical protein